MSDVHSGRPIPGSGSLSSRSPQMRGGEDGVSCLPTPDPIEVGVTGVVMDVFPRPKVDLEKTHRHDYDECSREPDGTIQSR